MEGFIFILMLYCFASYSLIVSFVWNRPPEPDNHRQHHVSRSKAAGQVAGGAGAKTANGKQVLDGPSNQATDAMERNRQDQSTSLGPWSRQINWQLMERVGMTWH